MRSPRMPTCPRPSRRATLPGIELFNRDERSTSLGRLIERCLGLAAQGLIEGYAPMNSPRRSPLHRWSVAALAALLLLRAIPAHAQPLELRFLNVGQGDAALIITPEGKHVLVDAGPSAATVLPYLRSQHYDTLDLVVASHAHADHIGGMTDVLASTVVRNYLDNGIPHTTATYQRTMQAVEASGARYLQATGRTITVGSARLRVLPPPSRQVDQNNGSVGILLEYGEFRALLTGDSQPTRPQVAVISVGEVNSYGHPSAQVIEQWQRAGAKVYRTDQDGTVIIMAGRDGSYVVLNERTGPSPMTPTPAPIARASDSTAQPARACCRVCTRGKACGNSCINRGYQCRQPTGCACDARP